jgi:hypothetical protein
MPEVRTRDEAISLVDRAFHEWVRTLTGVLTQANAVASGARADAERVVSRCGSKVSALEAALATADGDDRRRLNAELVRTRALHDQVRRASVRISDVATAVGQLNKAHASYGTSHAAAARGQLAAMSRAIEGYRGGGVGGGTGGSVHDSANTGRSSQPSSFGLSDVDVSAADLSDTPIQGEFGRGGASRADYRWAVQTWSDTVGPGVAKGMTRHDFAARDQRSGAPPLRRTVDVHDMFLGTDRIRVDRRADGSLNIVNGRHRFQIARDLGIKSLPGQVS